MDHSATHLIANYNGSDSFTYKVNDGFADSAVQTIHINITPVNDAPVGADGTVITLEDTAVSGNVVMTDVDGNGLSVVIAKGPAHGKIVFNSTSGAYSYFPDANYVGSDSFSYKVSDGITESSEKTIVLTVVSSQDNTSQQREGYIPPQESGMKREMVIDLSSQIKSNLLDRKRLERLIINPLI